MIPYGKQDINADDIDTVVEILKSDFLTQGPAVPAFEKALSNYCHTNHARAVNSATSALHLSCLALGLGPEDWLWTSPISFVASANCGLYCGAKVDFVDIDKNTYNLSIDCLKEKLLSAKKKNCLPKVVIPVHLCGQACEMEAIYKLSQEYGFKIIEDASHAIGGKYKGKPIGSCNYSDITVFSFHPVKIITTAEGGVVMTNNQEIAEKISLLRSHGITRDPSLMNHKPHGQWYYQQISLGYNYRMTDLQAALGTSQLKRLNQFVKRRNYLADRYDRQLKDLPLTTPWQHPDSNTSRHLYVIRLKAKEYGINHNLIFDHLRDSHIGVNLHYIPIHLQPYYQKLGFKNFHFTEAEKYYSEAISLPIYPSLKEEEQDYIINKVKDVLEK